MIKRMLLIFTLITVFIGLMAAAIFLSIKQNIPEKEAEKDPILSDAVLLENLIHDKSQRAEDKLMELSSRHDAVGYYANIELGRRLSGSDAAKYYKNALELYESNDIKKELASCLLTQGDAIEAAKTFASALPDSSALQSITNMSLGADTIGQILVDYNQYQEAVNFLKPAIDKAADEEYKIKLQKLYAKALAMLGKYNDALPLLADLKTKDSGDNNIMWWYARCLEALGENKKAKEIYYSLGNMGGYRLGLILEKEGRLLNAANAYLKSSDAESMWRGAYILDELGKHDKALETYLKLSKTQSVYQDDASYRAYVLIERSGGKEADDLIPIISKHPSWMTLLKKEPYWPQITTTTYEKPEFMKRMEAYEKSGRGKMAQIELLIAEKNPALTDKLALGDWYLSKGDYYSASKWGIRALSDQPDRHAYELAYQRRYDGQVKKAASEFDIDQNLIFAVIRGESSFNPSAISRVGAVGLMQIMPDTGKYIASHLNTPFNEKDLFNTDINIRFGTYYLKSLLDMFSGDIDKALAAYNGGPGNVKRWSATGIGSTREDFPTAVSFLETREYITKIQDSYYIYKHIYKDNY